MIQTESVQNDNKWFETLNSFTGTKFKHPVRLDQIKESPRKLKPMYNDIMDLDLHLYRGYRAESLPLYIFQKINSRRVRRF